MTRLFIRFYISVIALLFLALCITVFACKYRMDTDFDGITERVLGGGVRLARTSLQRSSADATVELLRRQFPYPVQNLSDEQTTAIVREWLSRGDDLVVSDGGELSVLTPLGRHGNSTTGSLHFGPVPVGDGAIETDMLIAIGAVLLLVAIAIASLLRPLAWQLSLMEQTAVAIADGNLAARVDVEQTDSARTLAQAFNDMAARTEALLRTQRELLQAVSHELRTPLSRIHFAIDLIRTAHSDSERDARLQSLDAAAQDLDDTVGELLQYVRLETGIPQPEAESIELLPLVEELIEKASLTCRATEFRIGPELTRGDVRMVADRSGLMRVLGNLLANAGRFSRRQVQVNARVSATETTIDVDDDGPGIPESDRERVFEPFVRLSDTDRGAGLGLALVKRILSNHNGTVAVQESPLGGCRVRTCWSN